MLKGRNSAFNTGKHVTPQRYPEDISKLAIFTKPLILLAEMVVVPVVGLEPTRLVTGPGF